VRAHSHHQRYDEKVANRTGVGRRPPISLYMIVARAEGCTYAAKVGALCLVQGPFSVVPRAKP
jgi:hypothetical protein